MKDPRAWKWSRDSTLAPLATGALGIRNAVARSRISSTRLALDPCVQFGGLLVGLLGDRQRRLLVDPVLMSGHRAQVEPLLRRAAADVDQPVLGPRDAGHREPSGVPPRPAEHLEVAHRIVGEAEDLRFEHRQVDQLCGAAHPRGHRRRAGVRPGEVVADLPADEYRCPVRRSAAEAHDPARPRLQRELGGRSVRPRTFQTERRDGRDGQMRMDAVDLGRCERFGYRRTARPHHRVGIGEQRIDEGHVGVGVGDDAVLRAREIAEQRAIVAGRNLGAGRRPPPQRISLRRFDFDDLGAAVGE